MKRFSMKSLQVLKVFGSMHKLFQSETLKKVAEEADGSYMEYFIKRIVFGKGEHDR